jgi:hypothetical protein
MLRKQAVTDPNQDWQPLARDSAETHQRRFQKYLRRPGGKRVEFASANSIGDCFYQFAGCEMLILGHDLES